MDPTPSHSSIAKDPTVLPERERAKALHYRGHVLEVIPLLEPILTRIDFTPEYFHDFSILVDAYILRASEETQPENRVQDLRKAMFFLSKTPEIFQDFIFNRGVVRYCLGDYKLALNHFRHYFERSPILDRAGILYFAQTLYQLRHKQEADALFQYVTGSNLYSDNDIGSYIREQKPLYQIEQIPPYTLGFGAINVDEMSRAVESLHLYQKRSLTLEKFACNIARKNIDLAQKEGRSAEDVGHEFFLRRGYALAAFSFREMRHEVLSVRSLREFAYSSYSIGDYYWAVEMYENLIRTDPPDKVLLSLELAEAYTGCGEFVKANDIIKDALEQYPADPRVLYAAGFYYFLRAENEYARPERNLSLWGKFVRQARDAIDLFQEKAGNQITPEQFQTVEAVKQAWERFREVRSFK